MKKYFIKTFGCQMNQSDSERIARILENQGYKKAKNIESADLIVVNACSVRQSAIDRIFGLKKKIIKLKAIKVLTGCVLESDKKKFKEFFDVVIDTKDIVKLPEAISRRKAPVSSFGSGSKIDYLCLPPKYESKFLAFVPIMTGCNNFCTYCVVPYTRGREQSRPLEEIIKEVKNLVKKGYKEIWLLGQNVNSYEFDFPKLLEKLNAIKGNFWLRFTSPHPKDFSDRLIKTIAKCEKVTNYINLPVQSGDNEILRKMNRSYTVEQYKNLVRKIRKAIPDICISTDVIVGFPSETKKQFQNTVKLFKEIKYDMAYISQYSPRPGTAAYNMKDDVSKEEKRRREKTLTKVLRKTSLENNKKYLGKIETVLIEKRRKNILIGKTKNYKTVRIEVKNQEGKIFAFGFKPMSLDDFIGKFVKVKIVKAMEWGLEGCLWRPLIVIAGPTAVGKSDLAVKLATWLSSKKQRKKFEINGAEIISADSRQVYKEMDIGTGKITKREMKGVPHHLLDIASPKRQFTVVQYQKRALEVIKKIYQKEKIPIICGGTGFYIQAVVEGLRIPQVKPDWKLRRELEKETTESLFKKLKKLDPERAKTIDSCNRRRLIRALEIVIKTKKPVPKIEKDLLFDVLKIGIKKNMSEIKVLIRKRLEKRLRQGMISEVKKLRKLGVSWERLDDFGLEYRYIARYLQGKITKQEMTEELRKEIEHYAKRQLTWFKKDIEIHWIKNYNEAKKLVKEFLS